MDTPKEVRPFGDFLLDQRNGALAYELTEALTEIVEAVSATGKVGSLSLTLKVKPSGKGARDTMIVSDVVVVKPPLLDRPETIYFLNRDSQLVRANPDATQMILREAPAVPVDISELKEAK
jgi:hypothetical protein